MELSMMELPDEIWDYIKEFTFDWKRTHKQKFRKCLTYKLGLNAYKCREIYERWTHFPPWPNTNDIIRSEYLNGWRADFAPRPNLELTSITWNVSGTGGFWCGYGWKRHPNLRKTPTFKLT